MPSVVLKAAQNCMIKSSAPTTPCGAGTQESISTSFEGNGLLISFASLAENLRNKRIVSVAVTTYISHISGQTNKATVINPLYGAFNAETATYSNALIYSDTLSSVTSNFTAGAPEGYVSATYGLNSYEEEYIAPILKNGVVAYSYSQPVNISTLTGNSPPYVTVNYEEAQLFLGNIAPQSGYVPKAKANTFSWRLGAYGVTYNEIAQSSAVFRWRADAAAMATEINITTANSITIPASTFTTSNVQWQVTATANTGQSFTSDWYTLSTVEALSTASIIEPKDVVVDGDKDVTLRWTHQIATGTAQSKYDVESSPDGTTYTALRSETTVAESYIAPAGTFAAGNRFWRVRTYNSENAAGEWSIPAKIVVVAAPKAPVVSVTASPRPTINWQSTGQQAFEVEVGSIKSGLQFGTGKNYRLQEYLRDGSYTTRVRIQNSYGLWSDWGSASFTVANVHGGAIALEVAATHNAILTWESTGTYSKFYIYRDGVLVGKTTAKSYIDNTSIGSVKYQVRGVNSTDDNYGLSEIKTVDVKCDTIMIADLNTGQWTKLEKTASSERASTLAEGIQTNYVYFSGAAYPSAEISEFKSKTISFDAAFAERAAADHFSKLLGKLVCVKNTWGDIVIGVLTAFSKTSELFFQAFSCDVEQVSYNEAVTYD